MPAYCGRYLLASKMRAGKIASKFMAWHKSDILQPRLQNNPFSYAKESVNPGGTKGVHMNKFFAICMAVAVMSSGCSKRARNSGVQHLSLSLRLHMETNEVHDILGSPSRTEMATPDVHALVWIYEDETNALRVIFKAPKYSRSSAEIAANEKELKDMEARTARMKAEGKQLLDYNPDELMALMYPSTNKAPCKPFPMWEVYAWEWGNK